MQNEWIENTGDVPDGVGPDTHIEVLISDGSIEKWDTCLDAIPNNSDYLWEILEHELNITRWRFLK